MHSMLWWHDIVHICLLHFFWNNKAKYAEMEQASNTTSHELLVAKWLLFPSKKISDPVSGVLDIQVDLWYVQLYNMILHMRNLV